MSTATASGGRHRRRGGEEESKGIETGEAVQEDDKGVRSDKQTGPLRPDGSFGGRRHSRRRKTLRGIPKGTHVKAKTLKRLLKSKGLKTSGKKSTLRARAREAHLIRGGR